MEGEPIIHARLKGYYRSLPLVSIYRDKLQTAQKKMIRYILGVYNRYHLTSMDFASINMPNVDCRFQYITLLCLMYDVFNGLAPDYL